MSWGILAAFACASFVMLPAYADVWIPEEELGGLYGADGTYAAIGVVKSSLNYSIVPTVSVQVQDGSASVSASRTIPAVMPGSELPFKIFFPGVAGSAPEITNASVSYVAGAPTSAAISVIYDDTLVTHPDGRVTGLVENSGSGAARHSILMAVAHGHDHRILDVAAGEPILEMAPGETRSFELRPDPAVAGQVWYYSCFAVGDPSAIALNTDKAGFVFPMRYVSGVQLAHPAFDDQGRTLTMHMLGSWPLADYVNLEFPMQSGQEEFAVLIDQAQADSIQSVDEAGNWHVAFGVEPETAGIITITGFDAGPIEPGPAIIPAWTRQAAGSWAAGEAADFEFAAALRHMSAWKILPPMAEGESGALPHWFKAVAGWWSEGSISDEEFIRAAGHLIDGGVIRA